MYKNPVGLSSLVPHVIAMQVDVQAECILTLKTSLETEVAAIPLSIPISALSDPEFAQELGKSVFLENSQASRRAPREIGD